VAPRACGRDIWHSWRVHRRPRWLPARAGATGHHDVEVARLADPTGRPVALFLTLDRTLQEELKPLSAAFFLDLFKTLSQLADASPTGELGRSVTIYGDELANIGAIPKMAVWISTLRSAGVAMLLVVQATAQLVALYGEEGAATIMGSCATKIGMSGMGPEDTRLFSDLAGKTTRVSAQASKQRGRFAVVSSGGGRSQAETAADLLTADQVRRLDPDELLAVVRYLPVARLRQCRWYRDRRLRRRVARARAQEAA
jgi:type IV secretion system protein VirD4